MAEGIVDQVADGATQGHRTNPRADGTELQVELLPRLARHGFSQPLIQWAFNAVLAITPSGVQQKLARDPLKCRQIALAACSLVCTQLRHGESELQSRQWCT